MNSPTKNVKTGFLGHLRRVFSFFCLFFSITASASSTDCLAYANRQNLWQEFREKNPYNYQTVGLKQFSDGSAIVLISEPSEDITIDGLYSIFSNLNIDADIKTFIHPMGYDGWLKDAVIAIDGMKSSNFDILKKNLFTYLYGTDYKAAFLNLESIPQHKSFSIVDLNLQVSAEELSNWFIDDKEALLDVDSGQRMTLIECLANDNSGKQGVFYSEKTGFVVWVINRNGIQNDFFRICARKFSLDSDLILGAICQGNSIAIIGRERSVPLYVLPPMRFETLQILASTHEKNLAQSYERNNIFAGKLSNNKDYAPIYLSDELWHTEYGSILNITDQMLKSWSENGRIQYDRFNYPQPIDWAFNTGAFKDLHAESLTYNWNTSGAGYSIDYGTTKPYTVYAVNRTGSLPVSFFPEKDGNAMSETDSIFMAEELAYDFFSNLSNPELVKVAQYASMYQIFTNFGISIQSETKSFPEVVTSSAYERQLTSILESIYNFHDRDLDVTDEQDNYNPVQSEAIEYYYNNCVSRLWEVCTNSSDSSDVLLYEYLLYNTLINDIDSVNQYIYGFKDGLVYEDYDATLNEMILQHGNNYDALIDAFKEQGTPFLASVSHYMINPREIDLASLVSSYQNGYDNMTYHDLSQLIAFEISDFQSSIIKYATILDLLDLDKAKEAYVLENMDKSLFWIKCPTIVQSKTMSDDSLRLVGGHNLNSKITPIVIDKTVASGSFKIDVINGKKTIHISPSDKGHVTPDFLRIVERTDISGTQNFSRPKITQRQRDIVAATTTKRSERGFNVPDHLDVVEMNSEGQLMMNGKVIENCNDLYRELAFNAQNHTGTSPKSILFKEVSEDMVQTIIDGTHSFTLSRGNEFKIPNTCHNFAKAKFKKNSDGTTLVSIPIEGFGIKAKESKHVFRVPTSKLEAFKSAIKELISDPVGVWNQFLYKRKMKSLDIQKGEIDDWIEHNKVAIIDCKRIDKYYVEFIQEEIA